MASVNPYKLGSLGAALDAIEAAMNYRGQEQGYNPCPANPPDSPREAGQSKYYVPDMGGLGGPSGPTNSTSGPVIRVFTSGANRSPETNKLDYEGFLSPLVLERFARYMHKNRKLPDGSLRASDNWQKGIPFDSYIKSAFRHFWEWWSGHRASSTGVDVDGVGLEESLCALMFNTQGYLHEILKAKRAGGNDPLVPGPEPKYHRECD